MGEAVKIPKAEIEGKALFPHVLVRNVKFEVNFGSNEPSHEIIDGFEMVGKIEDPEKRVRGPVRPSGKEDCEVSLVCTTKGWTIHQTRIFICSEPKIYVDNVFLSF